MNEHIKAFRLAIATNDHDAIKAAGTLTFLDDVTQTQLADITEEALQPSKQLIVDLIDVLRRFNLVNQSDVKGLALATFNKIESLAWKTYLQFIRKAYRRGTELQARSLRIE